MGKSKALSKNMVEQFKEMILLLEPCMDDYLYIHDLQRDYYCISPNAAKRFQMTKTEFYQVGEKRAAFVHPQDAELIEQELRQVMSGNKEFHNLQYRWLDKSGKPVWVNCRGRVIKDNFGKPEYIIGCINEIGEKQKADNVSGLLGESSLRTILESVEERRTQGFMLRIGIDAFKEINEKKGMEYGDMVLQRTAECISSVMSDNQRVYRIVADEFIVVDFSSTDTDDAKVLYRNIKGKVNQFIEENFYEVFYTISAGILMFRDVKDQSYLNLMKLSEFALNEAKNNGRNKYYVYVLKDYQEFWRKKNIISAMRSAINGEFKGFDAYFQPIISLNERRMLSAETLMRFSSDLTGPVSPVEFIPLLEESGLIIPVGKWILHQAMRACKIIRQTEPQFRISVNLSYVQVLKSDVLKDILAGLSAYGLPPDSIMIELTESGFLEQNRNFIRFCEGLRKYSIPLALDDFGTGYSNFHYLYNLSPNVIKVDRSFTLKALNSDYEYSLLRHMVDMTHSIDLKFCVEGIETEQELQKISQMGPDYIQGYFFGKPCTFHSFFENYVVPM